MTRVTTLALAAGTLTLATGSVAQAGLTDGYIQHEFVFDPLPGGGSNVVSFVTAAAHDIDTGEAYLNAQGIETLNSYWIQAELPFGASLSGAPGFIVGFEISLYNLNTGDYLEFDFTGESHYTAQDGWSAPVFEAYYIYQPGSGFQGAETGVVTGSWSAQIVPAPGAIALFGLAGLSGRRRRD